MCELDLAQLVERIARNQLRFEAFYREHPPRMFVYYAFYPLLFPYWLINRRAREEFGLYRGFTIFGVVLLDSQNRVRDVVELFRGTLAQTSVYPREVVKLCLEANAAAVILVHNHPSGGLEPSTADLALTDPSTGKITVAMGKGDSTFASATSYPVGRAPQSVVAVDLNRDGFRDLVAGSYSDNRLDVLINNGNGTFRTSGTYATLLNPIWLATADLNHDSKPDVIASQYDAKAGVSVFLGNGDGTLKSGQLIAVAPSTVGVATGDLDFDGDLDVVVVQESNQVQIYLNKGDATFTTGTPLMLGASSGQGVQVADLNADNIPDVVAVCAGSGFARVFLGLGNGTFLPEVTFASGAASPFNVVAADWNGDGLTDLALSESSAQKISILMNTTKR